MPTAGPQLTLDAVEHHIRERVFRATCAGDVGIELEWLTALRLAAGDRPSLEGLEALIADVGRLPHGGHLSIEPGGQLELSTLPHPTVGDACRAAADDLFVVDRTCQARGLDLIALGSDPVREPRRVITAPRYRAMNEHFDLAGPHGRTMMCNTASVQLNVGLGEGPEIERRWRVAHAIGPVLLAAFANSPLAGGRPTGWVSNRMRTWWGIDPSRTAPVPVDADPAAAWTIYALDANVMLVRAADDSYEPVRGPLPFGRWVTDGHRGGWPTLEDLEYHLTTLFPPVRPRGWLELRMFDSLPTPYWHVAVAVTTALLDDPVAGVEALAATSGLAPAADGTDPAPHATTAPSALLGGTADVWVTASKQGLRHGPLAAAADACFQAARDALVRRQADDATLALAADYHARFVARGRAPADDRIDAWRREGSVFPAPESPIPYAELEAVWT